MKNSWRHYLRRLATVTVVCGSVAWSSAMCYAARLAFDSADDPVYANGWQEGDNGGTNFTAWNFHGTYASTVQQRIDDGIGSGALGSSTFNDIERAWSLFNPVVVTGQRDIARAGRGFAPLTVGQTLKVVIDNPSEEQFFRGYFVRLTGNTGGMNGNICSDGTPCGPAPVAMPKQKMLFQMFDYFTYGEWGIAEGDGPDPNSDGDFFFTGLFDTDTVNPPDPPQVGTDSGARFEVTLTGTNTYQAKMIPLDNVGATFTHNGVLDNPGSSIDWIEFLHFNTQSEQGFDTDFFIRSIEITDDTLPGDYNQNGTVDAADYTLWRDHLGQSFRSHEREPGGDDTRCRRCGRLCLLEAALRRDCGRRGARWRRIAIGRRARTDERVAAVRRDDNRRWLRARSARYFRARSERYCSSVTCSSQSTARPSSFSWMAMWVIAVLAVAPCQCFSPGGNQITSPGRMSSTGPPQCWAQPLPAVTISVWPSGWVCQAVRAPGSKVTLAPTARAGAGASNRRSIRTVPVK